MKRTGGELLFFPISLFKSKPTRGHCKVKKHKTHTAHTPTPPTHAHTHTNKEPGLFFMSAVITFVPPIVRCHIKMGFKGKYFYRLIECSC